MAADLDTPEKVLEAAARECEASRCPEEALAERGQRGWMWGQHIEAAWRQAGQDCAKRIRALRSHIPAPENELHSIHEPLSRDFIARNIANLFCPTCRGPMVWERQAALESEEWEYPGSALCARCLLGKVRALEAAPRAEVDVEALIAGLEREWTHQGYRKKQTIRFIRAYFARQRSEEKP